MQRGNIIRSERKQGPAVWQFRWSETGPQGQRVYRKRVVGTVEDYASPEAVRKLVKVLIAKPSPADRLILQMSTIADAIRIGGKQSFEELYGLSQRESGFGNELAGTRFATPIDAAHERRNEI